MPELAVDGLGEELADCPAEQARAEDGGREEGGHGAEETAAMEEKSKEGHHSEHVGEVDFVATLTEDAQRGRKCRRFPLRGRGGHEEQRRAKGEDGHVEAVAAEAPTVGLKGEAKAEGEQGGAEPAAEMNLLARKLFASEQDGRGAAEGDGIHAAEIGVFAPNRIGVGGFGAREGTGKEEESK